MVNRALAAFDMMESGNNLVPGAFFTRSALRYKIGTADGDYVSESTFWDMKVSKNLFLTSEHTLQLAIYHLLGKLSSNDHKNMTIKQNGEDLYQNYRSVKKIGVINPRQNVIWVIDLDDVGHDVIETIARDVVGMTEDLVSIV